MTMRLRDELVRTARRMSELGLSPGMTGNVSVRSGDEIVGMHELERLQPDDLGGVDAELGGRTCRTDRDVGQLFGKLGYKGGDTELSLTASLANNDLNGNGLQDGRLLAKDWQSVYSQPDQTRNRAQFLNLSATRALSDAVSLSGNVYWRRIHTGTYNGDVNDDALDQAVAVDVGHGRHHAHHVDHDQHAKAAAQADFESRILACIEPQVQP